MSVGASAGVAVTMSAMIASMIGCGASTTPPAYSELEASRGQPVAHESAALAPEAFADAEHQRAEAERSHRDGDDATAGIEAERALAGYALVDAIAREKRAKDRETAATTALAEVRARSDAAVADRTRADAEAAELDAELRVAAHPANPRASGPAAHDREAARLRAAKSLLLEANELCTSANALRASGAAASEASDAGASTSDADNDKEAADVGQMIDTPAKTEGPVIDAAARHRAHCLASLARARGADAATNADALLVRVAQEAGLAPYRTEIGVAVTTESAFEQNSLRDTAQPIVAKMASLAAERGLPLLLVVHDATGSDEDAARGKDRAAAAARIASDSRPNLKTVSVVAGNTINVVDPADKANNARNERLDVVIVVR